MNQVNSNEEISVDTTNERIESWLNRHPQFVHDYFVRNASRQMVESWLLSHSTPQDLAQESSRLTSTSSGAIIPVRKTSAQKLESGKDQSR
ncbi:hypothetical protein CEXT_743811 [Caerostris extrusa]|uniref:Uncharacterized protein n=1 Tax=Caerostris extrusa TaxID=172846 RepID=A0AAV4QPB8_CAEEX|nr:hypothetical protein CEXT_743811 [Caerostris extrusa]